MSISVVLLRPAGQNLRGMKSYNRQELWQGYLTSQLQQNSRDCGTLQIFPLGGKIPEELEKLNLTQYRQVLSGMNRIIYEVRQQTVYIHIVCDTRKDMRSLLTKRLLRNI